MEKEYHIGHAIVSLIFVTTAAGFILAAPFIDALDGRIRRARTFITAEMLIIIGFVMIACTPPYAVVAIAFFLNGYGAATTLALNNVFLANLAGATVLLGAGHGCYGIGGRHLPQCICTAQIELLLTHVMSRYRWSDHGDRYDFSRHAMDSILPCRPRHPGDLPRDDRLGFLELRERGVNAVADGSGANRKPTRSYRRRRTNEKAANEHYDKEIQSPWVG